MLTVLGLDIRLLADDNGQPGAPINPPAETAPELEEHGPVMANDFFWVEVLAWDARPTPSADPGVIGLPLNIAWDPNVLAYAGATPIPTNIPLPPSNPPTNAPRFDRLITASFPLARELSSFEPTADAATCNGLVDPSSCNFSGLQGSSSPTFGFGQAIGTSGPETFSQMRFQALAAADRTPFLVQLAGGMSFTDSQPLQSVIHLVDGQPETADDQNRIVEFVVIEEAENDSSLSGVVYTDVNLNGLFEPEFEFGLPNVAIQLFGADPSMPLAEVTTGPDGWYHFEELPPGEYTIVEQQPADFVSAINTLGTVLPGGEQRGTVGIDEFVGITLAAGEHGVEYNFGENLRNVTKRFFTARAEPRDLLCEHLGQSCVTVRGTDGDDTIRLEADAERVTVTVNDSQPQEFSTARFDRVTVDGGAGRDTVTLVGSEKNDTAHLTTLQSSLRSVCYAALTANAEVVTAEGRSGDDFAVFSDLPTDENLLASDDEAVLSAPLLNTLARARFFEQVRATSAPRAAADRDTLQVQPVRFRFNPVGKWVPI